MDVATATATTTSAAKTPEADSETPTRIQPNKPLSFSNGVLKRHHSYHHHHHHHVSTAAPVVVSYKECLKNHAASLGGHALDGCGEFMPSPIATPTDPTSLKCAACGCHRNFHRREPDEQQPQLPASAATTTHVIEYQPHHRHHPPPPPQPTRSPGSHSPPPISSSYYPSAPHMLLALSAGLSGPPPPPPPLEINTTSSMNLHASTMGTPTNPNGRKRFRTRFSQGQKEKMHEFAERVGWKMQKSNEEVVAEFCNEIGVDRGVLKVWMHNNKNTVGKRDVNGSANNLDNGNGNGNGNGNNSNNSNNSNNNSNENQVHHHNDSSAQVATNGSSSSS